MFKPVSLHSSPLKQFQVGKRPPLRFDVLRLLNISIFGERPDLILSSTVGEFNEGGLKPHLTLLIPHKSIHDIVAGFVADEEDTRNWQN